MPHPSLAVVGLLCLLVAAEATYEFGTHLKRVKTMEQLWRYQVGPSAARVGVTPGNAYICLRDWEGRFIRGTAEGPRNDADDCSDSERFTVAFVGDGNNHVTLKDQNDVFIRCTGGTTGAASEPNSEAQFILYVNADEDELYLFNPTHNAAAAALETKDLLTCTESAPNARTKFFGWKMGPKIAWKAQDEWSTVQTLDNSEGQLPGKFTFSKPVGTVISQMNDHNPRVSVSIEAGTPLRDFFKSSMPTAKIDWSQESNVVWSAAKTMPMSIDVPAGGRTIIYQALGRYGVFTIMSDKFTREDLDSDGKLVKKKVEVTAS